MSGRRIDNVFLALLYPREDETHRKAIEALKRGLISSKWEYYIAEHDKDIDENGELKKAHSHLVVFTSRKIARSTFANTLGVAENYVSYCNDVQDELMYLTHSCPKGKDKYQYPKSTVETNSSTDYSIRAEKESSRNLSEEDKAELLDLIFSELERALYAGKIRLITKRDVVTEARKKGIGNYAMRNHQYVGSVIDDIMRHYGCAGFEPVDELENPYYESEKK